MVLGEFAKDKGVMLEVVKRCCEEAGVEILGSIELQSDRLRRRAAHATRGGVERD